MTNKCLRLNDTIASIASFPDQAAVGVIKISGPKSLSIISRIFLPRRKKDLKKARTYTLHYGWIVKRAKSREHRAKGGDGVVDEVLVGIMRAPFSYTRDDVAEIYSHSGQVVLNKVLELVLKNGARLASPGEFTKRAFLSGRIDLAQAEAVPDIVNARSEEALRLGLSQLQGVLSSRIAEIEELIKDVCMEMEADLSFPEDVQANKSLLIKKIKNTKDKITELLKDSERGRFLREGIQCVICGRANVGKSSLLNMLLREERVIVTPVAGTTRDVVEDNINIRGLSLKIYDTAGILEPKDLIERKAMEKSHKKIDDADLVILVLDGSGGLTKDDFFLIDRAKGKKSIFLINKIDLPQEIEEDRLHKFKNKIVKISALKHQGLGELEQAIINVIFKGGLKKDKETFVSNIRHIALLKDTLKLVDDAEVFLSKGYSLDFVFFSLRDALDKISLITGKAYTEDILDSIFSEFCIGK